MNHTRTMLLVEDKASDVALVLRALDRAKITHRVDVVRDGQEALDYLFGEGLSSGCAPRPLPAVVVLDVNLPRVNGLDVLQRLRADSRTRCLPVVLLTSSDEERDRRRAYERGASGFVRKALDPETFAASVARLGAYWLTVNEPPPA